MPQDASPVADEPTNDLASSEPAAAADQWEYQARPTAGALQVSLDSVARRRLQMVDAMASFSSESSAMLELQPHRRVDARTLELLTAVSGIKSAA